MKDLLISHTDLDGISNNIILNLANRKYDYHNVEITELKDLLDELLQTDLSIYENIYITDLTVPENYYKIFQEKKLKVQVFDHHETHLYATNYPNTFVTVKLNNRPTCGTELFYEHLKKLYPILDTSLIKSYVELVRQIDTYDLTSDMPKELGTLKHTYGTKDFIKKITPRLKKNKQLFEFTAFEKRYLKIHKQEEEHFFEKKEKEMQLYEIEGKKCGVVFTGNGNKSELGNRISKNHPEIDLVIIIDTAKSISYRTARDDISVSEFASQYGGGGHKKASGSDFNDAMREEIIKMYFNNVKRLENETN